MSIAPGNKTHIFPTPPPNSTEAREDAIVSNTERQMFHDTSINNPATTHGGGTRNTLAAMGTELSGKQIQESYRSGLERSREAHDRVTDR